MNRVISIKTVSRDGYEATDAIIYVVMVNKEIYSVQFGKALHLRFTKKGVCSYLNLQRKALCCEYLILTMTIDGSQHISTYLHDTHLDINREMHRKIIKDFINVLDTTQ